MEKYNIETEIWKDVPNWSRYQASNLGNIRSKNHYPKYKDGRVRMIRGKVLKQTSNNVNALYVTLCNDETQLKQLVHRVVAETFLPNPDNKPEVNHIDGDRENNKLYNLEWVTGCENVEHAMENNLIPSKEEHYNAKLTQMDVDFIRKTYARKHYKQKELAEIFDVSTGLISAIIRRKTWK